VATPAANRLTTLFPEFPAPEPGTLQHLECPAEKWSRKGFALWQKLVTLTAYVFQDSLETIQKMVCRLQITPRTKSAIWRKAGALDYVASILLSEAAC
jgi:hypothetical protein